METVCDRVAVLAAWTASKSFAQYGARVGALIASIPDASHRLDVENAISYTCRGFWSNCNHLGLLAVSKLLLDDDLRTRVGFERSALVSLLSDRVDAFNAAAGARGLVYPRYEGGFFVSVFTPDAEETARVAAAEGVYVVPMDGAVRLALCAVPKSDIPRLVDAVSRGVDAAAQGQGPCLTPVPRVPRNRLPGPWPPTPRSGGITGTGPGSMSWRTRGRRLPLRSSAPRTAPIPSSSQVVRALTTRLATTAFGRELPRAERSVTTRMAAKHGEVGTWRGEAVDPAAEVVVLDVIRGGSSLPRPASSS